MKKGYLAGMRYVYFGTNLVKVRNETQASCVVENGSFAILVVIAGRIILSFFRNNFIEELSFLIKIDERRTLFP